MKRQWKPAALLLALTLLLTACERVPLLPASAPVTLDTLPDYSGSTYVEVNGNVPYFEEQDLQTSSYESYGALDSLGRCTAAVACIGTDLLPTEPRGSISSVKPTGWHSVQYDNVDGGSLYNRSHLIGYQLTGENANERNLITGTRYMNMQGMEPFESMVKDYIVETSNHVLYRVTPIFDGDNLVASGVLMEAQSVEDNGADICYCVYLYNVQPGITIDYKTGDSALAKSPADSTQSGNTTYILNTNTMKFHLPTCASIEQITPENKQTYAGSRYELLEQGYSPCKNCNP